MSRDLKKGCIKKGCSKIFLSGVKRTEGFLFPAVRQISAEEETKSEHQKEGKGDLKGQKIKWRTFGA